jgi:hypothetical protein
MKYSGTKENKRYPSLGNNNTPTTRSWCWDRNIRVLTEAVEKMGRLIEGVKRCPNCSKLLLKPKKQ